MATKDELKDDILALDPNATIAADATHDDLTVQLREVRATREELEKLAAEKLAAAADALEDSGAKLATAEKLAALKPKGYRVAKGKSLTTGAGIKSEGQEVTAKMVTGGEGQLKLLKERGHLV